MKNSTWQIQRCQALIPHVIVVLWLVYLGVMIWQHAIQSVQPPNYDPLKYIQKAMNFWKAVDQGELFNPLNIEPAVRPPGTILMSYPFGFSDDFRGYHFRSVFLPILCMVFAVYLASGIPRTLTDGWGVAAAAILFSAIPTFYNFDLSEINYRPSFWGLVDNFQGGIAALAMAGYIRSLKARSLLWLLLGASIGSFTLLIKPSGLMIMALLTLVWLIVVILEGWWAHRHQQSVLNLRRYVIIGGLQTFLIYAVVVLFCIFSNYFSKESFAYARQALGVMRSVLKVPPSDIFYLVFSSFGIAFVLWVLVNGLHLILNFSRRNERKNGLSVRQVGLILSVLAVWCLGTWYWLIVQSGGSQVRYFFPFLMMGMVCIIPISSHVFQYCHLWMRRAILVLCFAPMFNIGVLLALESPAIAWQRFTGVNVSVGKDKEEVNQACVFLDELKNRKMSANLFSFFSGVLPDSFIMVGAYQELVWPDLPVFKTASMVDWVNGFVVKTDQLLNADYILVRKDLNSMAEKLNGRMIDTSDAENILFQAWLSSLDINAGVKPFSEGSVLRLLEIVDRKAFEYAVATFMSEKFWRPEFIAANSPPRWSNKAGVSEYAKEPAATEIVFGDAYQLHVLSLHRLGTGLKIELWWEKLLCEGPNSQQIMFFHLVDPSGKMLMDFYLPLDKYYPPFDDRRWRYGTVTVDQPLPDDATAVAFGIFSPDHRFLMPDKGVQDWNGIRVLVPIPINESK